jgi:cell division protein FtsA
MGFATVPSKGVRRGQIVDINQVTNVIEECIEKAERMAGTKIESALVSVGGPHIESLNSQGVVAVSQPEVDISDSDVARVVDAAKAISLSSTREIIEVTPREYIVDGQSGIKNPIGMSGVRLEVNTHIITAGSTNLKNIDRCLNDLGVRTEGYIFSGLASSLAVVSDTEMELGVASVDIGGGKIDLSIYVEGSLSYSTSIPVGARHITNDIAVGLRVSLESAERIKMLLSQSSSEHHKSDTKSDQISLRNLHLPEGLDTISRKTIIDGIIRPRIQEIFERVYDEIEKSDFGTQVPSGLVLSGGGALTVDILDAAKRVIGLPARIGIPQHISGLTDEVTYPEFATVCGLIIYGKDITHDAARMQFKDFDKIFKNVSMKVPFKKVKDLVKSFIP